jgi:hypothetical protein
MAVEDRDVVVESGGLPAAELQRVIDEVRAEFADGAPAVQVDKPGHRGGVDPTIVVAIISGIFSVTVPFVTALASRVFAKEPDATVALVDGPKEVVIDAGIAPEDQARLIQEGFRAGATRVRIDLAD